MAQAKHVKVTATPTKIIDGTIAEDSVVIRNGAEAIDLGGSGVKTGEGYKLAKEAETPALLLGSSIWGVAPEGKESTVEVLAV